MYVGAVVMGLSDGGGGGGGDGGCGDGIDGSVCIRCSSIFV